MNTVGLFAKYWQAGKVKTRLAKSIGNSSAATVHWECLSFLLQVLNEVGERRFLVYSPVEKAEDFAEIAGNSWEIQPQTTGDLGRRMQFFFQDAFAAGAQSVLVIGADAPSLDAPLITETWERLQTTDAVIGPSADGGYYLLGLRRPISAIFADMPWSTPVVLETTLQRLRDEQLSFSLLPTLTDIDDIASLHQVLNDLRASSPTELAQRLIAQLSKHSQINQQI